MKKQQTVDMSQVQRFLPDVQQGLCAEQIAQRKNQGLTNKVERTVGKSYTSIFIDNIFTFFNMIYIFLATVLIIYGQWNQITFALVAFFNTAIAIFQEIRSKKSLDKFYFFISH